MGNLHYRKARANQEKAEQHHKSEFYYLPRIPGGAFCKRQLQRLPDPDEKDAASGSREIEIASLGTQQSTHAQEGKGEDRSPDKRKYDHKRTKEQLGRPAEEAADLLFYNLVEGANGGYYVSARLMFDQHGLSAAELGFGHVSMELQVE